jgi:hypothetical protein
VQTKRRTERVSVELPVTWLRGGRQIRCTALDINAGGMFLGTDVVVAHGALMRIVVQLDDGALELFVTARYVGRTMSGRGIGVELFLFDEAGQARWTAFYRSQLRRAQAAEPMRQAG